eukprot:s59_g90.t1
MPVCDEVTALSDTDGEQAVDERPQKRLKSESAAPRSGGRRVLAAPPSDPQLRSRLARLLQGVCFCSRKLKTSQRQSCYVRFRDKLDELVGLRQELSRLHKLDADHRVCELIRASINSDSQKQFHQSLFGIPLCSSSFRRLIGLGQDRFQKLRKSVVGGLPVPRDGRFVARKNTFKVGSEKRQLCVEFLEEIYNTIAEVLPESHGGKVEKDDDPEKVPRPLSFRKHRGRRPRIASKSRGQCDRKVLRLLPPGSFTDYLNLLRARHPSMSISLKLFSQAP